MGQVFYRRPCIVGTMCCRKVAGTEQCLLRYCKKKSFNDTLLETFSLDHWKILCFTCRVTGILKQYNLQIDKKNFTDNNTTAITYQLVKCFIRKLLEIYIEETQGCVYINIHFYKL